MATKKRAAKAKSAVKRAVKKVTSKAQKVTRAKPAPKAAAAKPSARPAGKAPSASAGTKKKLTVEQYIATKVPAPWKAVMAELRMTVKTACPEADEGFKWGQPVYECNGPFAWMKFFSKYVGFGFWRGAELNDPYGVLEGKGNRMRHVKITDPAKVPIEELDHLIRQAVELNLRKGDPSRIRLGRT